jgi:hypothetical protein
VSVNGKHVEDKMRRFKGECEHFSFNESPIYTHDGASAKFSTNSQENDNSVYVSIATVRKPVGLGNRQRNWRQTAHSVIMLLFNQ